MKSKFDFSIVGIVGLPAAYGGFETLAEQLVKFLAADYRVQVICSKKMFDSPSKLHSYCGAELKYIPLNANGWQSVLYDLFGIAIAAPRSRSVLILGVSGCLFLPLAKCLWPTTRFVVNIDGIEWKRQKWGRAASYFLRISESIAVRYADSVIADNKGIAQYVERRYGRGAIEIPYGGDHQELEVSANTLRENEFLLDSTGKKYALSICRIEPENNISTILDSFRSVPNRSLVIIGNWEVSAYGRNLREEYSSVVNVHLLDPIYDLKILKKIRNQSNIYIHGHSAGGTNPSLVEAMWSGIPILAYDVNYNRFTTEQQAYYWSNKDELVSLLTTIDCFRLMASSKKMLDVARSRYRWSSIIEDYKNLLFLCRESNDDT